MHFRTELDSSWAEGLDYFHMKWIYRPQNLLLPDGNRFYPDFYLPEQKAFIFTMSGDTAVSYRDLLGYQAQTGLIFVVSEGYGSFYVLGHREWDSFICRCHVCGKFFFTSGRPVTCPLCSASGPDLTDFFLSGEGVSGSGM